ncbi:hypothetical protein E4U55_006350 [Claviceps digitariae]|nr:hypothetical protein E4U55_006350 [Claviceps digitariae]
MSVFAPGDLENLVQAGLASPPDSASGTIRVHKRRLNRSSDSEEAHISLSPSSMDSGDSYTNIPDAIESLATIRYLGLTDAKAYQVWTQWADVRAENDSDYEITFIEFIVGCLTPSVKDDPCEDNDDQWYQSMDQYGINDELQEAIMDPRFKDLRLSNSCFSWVRNTVEARFLGLREIQETSRERERARQRASQRPGGSQMEQTSDLMHDEAALTVMSDPAIEAAHPVPGFTTLFKGMSTARLYNVNDIDSSINVLGLGSSLQTDFSSRKAAVYFAVDREVAARYALWAKRRHPDNSACLLQIRVPNSAIESLRPDKLRTVYWDPTGNDKTWEKLIFNCRNGRQNTKALGFSEAVLIIGTISGKPNAHYGSLGSYEQITAREVFRNADGQPAVQYAWIDEEGESLLESFCLQDAMVFKVSSQELTRFI